MFRELATERLIVPLALVTVLAWPTPGLGQMSARVRGRVLDINGQPVEGAVVTFDFQAATRRLEETTDDRGRYVQMGLQSGSYTITAEKEGVGRRIEEVTLRVGQQIDLDLVLMPAGMVDVSKLPPDERADYERELAVKPRLDAAAAASRAGNYDEAIAHLEEALASSPNCLECHHGIGVAYASKKDYPNSEAAFKRALEINAEFAPAYMGLSSIYNAQRRFDEAAEASQQAAEVSGGGEAGVGADAKAIFSQGLINWNAGRTEEAKAQFLQTLELDPNHGEAHYWMGMAHLNAGQLAEAKAEFGRYLELEPAGRFADQATAMMTQLP